jgi:hypothetical protein
MGSLIFPYLQNLSLIQTIHLENENTQCGQLEEDCVLLLKAFSFQVEVLYFAKSAEIAGVRSETISVSQEIKALQLWNEIEARHPG